MRIHTCHLEPLLEIEGFYGNFFRGGFRGGAFVPFLCEMGKSKFRDIIQAKGQLEAEENDEDGDRFVIGNGDGLRTEK